ncbi:hypothetical protein MW887_001821 [Aspergillus wentii]|nr:hypothetical protein MW887_001821 [Aspergillus wentii]
MLTAGQGAESMGLLAWSAGGASGAYAGHLSETLRREKARVQELRGYLRELTAMDGASRDRRLAELVSQLDLNEGCQSGIPQDTEEPSVSPSGEPEAHHVGDNISYDGGAQFSVDTEGREHYFGATSRFHAVPDHDHRRDSRSENDGPETQEMENYHRKWLYSNARFQASWEKMAHGNVALYTDVDPNICSSLLEVYWSWQAPLHNCVYRRCFYRDMALGGPYFSRFLLNVIFAHACRHMPENDPRFAPFERGETFLRDAMLLLIDEMKQSKPRIPTIQGLLILGGRQCAVGKSSEGWLYTGMAIRMTMDLGLHIKRSDASLLEGFEPDDLEVRKRLYLSVYAWDKSISLCLGRPPSLKHTPYEPSALFDLSDDNDLWQPPHLLETDKFYPETKCHSTMTFVHFCSLAQIINECYNSVYNGSTRNINPSVIFALEDRLAKFHRNLPDSLKVDEGVNLQSCVPPHILCLNILCRTTLILLYRPFFVWCWNSELREHPLAIRAQTVCTEQTVGVNDLFRAYGQLFDFGYQSYLISYCVYTAATIDVRLARHDDASLAETAANRLAVTLRMLETEVKQTPGIRRSIEIIRSQMGTSRVPSAQAGKVSRVPNAREKSAGMNGMLPPMASPPQKTVSDTSWYALSNECARAEQLPLHPSNALAVGMDSNLPIEGEWADWCIDDLGGGFVPDMAYWSSFDQHF